MPAFGADKPIYDGGGLVPSTVPDVAVSLNLLWVVIGAVLVIFMQAGFALVETGFTRAKHASHVMSTNFAIFGLGFVGFFLVGYPLMFGGYSAPVHRAWTSRSVTRSIGSGNWIFLWQGGWASDEHRRPDRTRRRRAAFFLYMVAFMDTVATIPTGAMAERWKWKAFVGWGLFCGAIYYPLFGAWTWGGGWLAKLGNTMELGFGYVDFAGSGVVHAVGGVAALAGAIVLGARIGKYGPDGKPRTLAAHNIPMAHARHVHPAVRLVRLQRRVDASAATDVRFAMVATNTAIAAAFGAVGRDVLRDEADGQARPRHDVQRHARRSRGDHGAVRVRAAVGGGGHRHHRRDHRDRVVLLLRERKGIDDPVGAISVHGVGGIVRRALRRHLLVR